MGKTSCLPQAPNTADLSVFPGDRAGTAKRNCGDGAGERGSHVLAPLVPCLGLRAFHARDLSFSPT